MQNSVGVYICRCGTNISENIDIDELVQFSSRLDNVAYVKDQALLCSEDGKNFLADDVSKEKPDRVVIVACTPKEHEKTFRNTLPRAEFNPYLFQMVNIREQVAWVTADKSKATEKAKSYIRAAVKRVTLQEPLEKKEIDCNTDVLVIGAGTAGIEAALLLAKAGLHDMKKSSQRWSALPVCLNRKWMMFSIMKISNSLPAAKSKRCLAISVILW